MGLEKGLISVIMSNYNTPEVYLRTAIESILSQTYQRFEFIIVDDCSTDNSVEIIESYNDSRIIVLKNSENMGITKSLNKALCVAKGEYIARMDADDESLGTRFEKQVQYLKDNPSVVVCGTWVEIFGEATEQYKNKYSCKSIPNREEFQIQLLFGNHTNIIHPTAMFRYEVLLENNIRYEERYIYAQDYRMWVSCSRVGECSNVPEVLFRYRVHNKAISSNKKNAQMECTKGIMNEQLNWMQLSLPDDWEIIHHGFFIGRKKYDLRYKEWIQKIISNNKRYHIYNQDLLEELLWSKWAEISYFGIYQERGFNKIRVFLELPIRCYKTVFSIRKQRRAKDEK